MPTQELPFGAANAARHHSEMAQGTNLGKKSKARMQSRQQYACGRAAAMTVSIELERAPLHEPVAVAAMTAEERGKNIQQSLAERRAQTRRKLLRHLRVVESYLRVVLGKKEAALVDEPAGGWKAVAEGDMEQFIDHVGRGSVEKGGYYTGNKKTTPRS